MSVALPDQFLETRLNLASTFKLCSTVGFVELLVSDELRNDRGHAGIATHSDYIELALDRSVE
jgi:hypothetical protein